MKTKNYNIQSPKEFKVTATTHTNQAVSLHYGFRISITEDFNHRTTIHLHKAIKQYLFNQGYTNYMVNVEVPENIWKTQTAYTSLDITLLYTSPTKIDLPALQTLSNGIISLLLAYNGFEVNTYSYRDNPITT